MINTIFYSFSKRKNSTALPGTGTASAAVSVLLKDSCNQENPVLELESNDPDNYNSYNYVWIPFFSRYYFVVSKTVDNGKRLFISLEEDYLGSFKSAILNSRGFIKYSAQGLINIPDPRMARTINYIKGEASAAFPAAVGGNNYFISIQGEKTTKTYYITKNKIDQLFIDCDLANIQMTPGSDETSAVNNLGAVLVDLMMQDQALGSVFNNLKSAYILPFPPDNECLGGDEDIYAGHYNTQVQAEPLVENVFSQAIAITIPWTVNDWRRCSPYTEVYLYLPFFGIIPIDTNTVTQSSYFTVKYSICYGNGDLSYSVETDDNRIISTGTTNVRSEYGVGASNSGVADFASFTASTAAKSESATHVGAVVGTLMGSPILTAATLAMQPKDKPIDVSGAAKVVGQGLNSLAGILDSFGNGFSTAGGLGGFSSRGLELRLKCWTITKEFSDSQANFSTLFGLPLFQVANFSDRTGFLQTEDFEFADVSATLKESTTISRLLDSGIYIE